MPAHPSISFVIPTRNRRDQLRLTLDRLGGLDLPAAEVIVVDNASDPPAMERCALPTTLVRLEENLGAAARNVGALRARSPWIVMLDDDSSPVCAGGLLEAIEGAPGDAAAVMADIHLSEGRGRERGGLPEVLIGCGVAIRREAFLDAGGYDAAFGYYAEEYDLCAKLLLAGHRVVFDPRFRVEHRKAIEGRDADLIVERLVRNNGWVMQRYAPEAERMAALRSDRARYRSIAMKEHAVEGFRRGLLALRRTVRSQPRAPMNGVKFDRFTGLAHARRALSGIAGPVAVVDRGKNAMVVDRALAEAGVRVVDDPEQARVVVPGTMSPGPMIDAALAYRRRGAAVACPWLTAQALVDARPAAIADAHAA